MRIRVKLLLFILVGSLIFITPVSAAVKSGGSCKKVGTTTTSGGKKYTCVKSGTRLVWNKGIAVKPVKPSTSTVPSPAPEPTLKASPTPTTVPTPTPTPEPIVLPTTFDDLFVNRKGISLAAWQKSSEIIKANKSKAGTLEIFTGPNTKPNFDDYPTPVGLVSRLFPSKGEPTRTIVIRYRYVDIEWAQTTLRSKLTAEDFTRLNNNEGGKVILGRCDESAKNCMGAMQQSTFSGT